jgi:hypothetical protein
MTALFWCAVDLPTWRNRSCRSPPVVFDETLSRSKLAPARLSVYLISIYKTMSYIFFDEISPVVQTPRCRAANWVLIVLADPAAPVGAALAAKLWLCSEEFAAEAAPTRTSADLISTYKTMSYLMFDGRELQAVSHKKA